MFRWKNTGTSSSDYSFYPQVPSFYNRCHRACVLPWSLYCPLMFPLRYFRNSCFNFSNLPCFIANPCVLIANEKHARESPLAGEWWGTGNCVEMIRIHEMLLSLLSRDVDENERYPALSPLPPFVVAVTSGDDTVLLTPGRMSQRQVKERDKDKEKEKEAGLQTPNREHVATPSNLSPGVSYSHGEPSSAFSRAIRDSCCVS